MSENKFNRQAAAPSVTLSHSEKQRFFSLHIPNFFDFNPALAINAMPITRVNSLTDLFRELPMREEKIERPADITDLFSENRERSDSVDKNVSSAESQVDEKLNALFSDVAEPKRGEGFRRSDSITDLFRAF